MHTCTHMKTHIDTYIHTCIHIHTYAQHIQVCTKTHTYIHTSGPAESVRLLRFWLDQFFSQGKSKIPFLQKASNKQSASVILGLIRLIIIDRKGISRGVRLLAAPPPPHSVHFYAHKVLCCAKVK